MNFTMNLRYKCENPEIIVKSIQQDDVENEDFAVNYSYDDLFIIVQLESDNVKSLQKAFNSFSQRFKLACDAYDFCKKKCQK